MQPAENGSASRGDAKLKSIAKVVSMSLVAGLIFLTGLGVGNGAITFGAATENTANKDLPENLDYTSVEHIYDMLKANYDGKLDSEKLLDGLKDGLAHATGDPYTQYLNEKEAKEFKDELNGSFTGIGAELGEDEDGNLIIVSPIDGFPASKAGLRPQDMIISIDGTTTTGMTIDEAVKRIRGPKDTKVELRIFRNKTEDLKFTLVRDDIKIPSVKWNVVEGTTVGYIKINQFGPDTTSLMNQAARELKGDGAKSILLDLRGNPGGLLSSSIEIASMWLPQGKTILQEKRGGVVSETYTANGGNILRNMKTVVLINQGSASASEIVAGALRDNNAATVYGEKSYGKGSVQEIKDLSRGGEIKVTIARWYRPNGQNIDKKGITPDKEIKMTDEDYKQKRDPQKDAAIQFLQGQ